jgi:hypothetical protein
VRCICQVEQPTPTIVDSKLPVLAGIYVDFLVVVVEESFHCNYLVNEVSTLHLVEVDAVVLALLVVLEFLDELEEVPNFVIDLEEVISVVVAVGVC